MAWRAFLALVAGAIIIAGALAFMLPLHAFAAGCGPMVTGLSGVLPYHTALHRPNSAGSDAIIFGYRC